MKRFYNCFFIVLFLLFIINVQLMAQGDPGNPGCDPDDPGCPIDGGLTALLAVGAIYGIKKVKDSRKS